MASNAEVISALNSLIETCRDGQEGFKTAAEGVRGEEPRRLFREYSQQRARWVTVNWDAWQFQAPGTISSSGQTEAILPADGVIVDG